MRKVFSFQKNSSVAPMDAPTSGAMVSPTSGAMVSPTSGAMVSPTSGALVSPTSGAMVSPTSGAMVSPTSGAMVSPTSGALVSPTSGAMVSPTSGALAYPTSGAMVSPTRGTVVSPTSGAMVPSNSRTVDSPTRGAMVAPTSEAIVSPTSQGSGGMEARRPNFQDKGMKAIHKAAREGNKWRMKKILFFGTSDVNATDGMSRTALHVACAYGHPKMVKLLLKRHCIVDNSDCENKTALIYALQYRNTECAQLLLHCLPNLYIKDKDGNTAIHYAALCHSKTVVGMMLTLGADIEAKNKDGLTPLELAKLAKNDKMVEFLISRGAKRNPIKRKQQHTAEYKEENRTQTSKSNNLAKDPEESPKPAQNKTKSETATDPEESPKQAQIKTKSETDAICAESSFNSKKELLSKYTEEKNPPKSDSSNLATDAEESPKPAQIKTKSKTVDAIFAESSFISNQQPLSKYSEERKPPKSESSNLAVDETSAEGSLNSKQQLTSEYEDGRTQTLENSLFVEDISDEDSLISKQIMPHMEASQQKAQNQNKQQLNSEYQEKRRPHTCESTHWVVTDVRHTRRQAWTETKSKKSKRASLPIATDPEESPKPTQNKTKSETVDAICAESSFNSKQQLLSKYTQEKNTPKSDSSNLATDPEESPKLEQIKTKSETVDAIFAESSFISNQQLFSKYTEERKPPKSESSNLAIDLQESSKPAQTKTQSKTAVDETSAEGSLNSKQQLTSEYEEGRTPTLENSLFVEDISDEDSLISKQIMPHMEASQQKARNQNKQQLTSEYQEKRRPYTFESTHRVVTDVRHTRRQAWTETKSKKSKRVTEIPAKDSLSRLSSKSGIDDAWPTSHNEDVKEKVISKTCILTAKTSENQSKQIYLPLLHLEKMSQESQINRAYDKEGTSAYSGHPSVQKNEEMCIKQGILEHRKNLQLSKDESKQKSHELSIKLKMTECPEEEPLHDKSEGGASLRQMPSILISKMLDCERKDAFRMSVSAALQTFPERGEPTLKIVSPSCADPRSQTDSPSSSSSECLLRAKELHSENDHKPIAEYVLNKTEESFYNDTENKKVRLQVVTSEVREDQELAMKMNLNTTDWKLDFGPTPQSSDPKSHFDLWLVGCNETKPLTELKSHNMPAVTNTYKEIKPNQNLFQKPVCADKCSANCCKSVNSRLKDESSSALHNDRTPGIYVNEEYLQRHKNDLDLVKVEYLAWKKEKIQLQKEVEGKKKQKSSKREASGTMYDGADVSDSVELSQQSNSEHTDNQQTSDENTVIFVNKVGEKKKQKKREVSGDMDDGADDSDSVGWSKQSNREQANKQQVSILKDKESDRFTLKEEKEKKQKVDLLYEKNRVQLRKKEMHSIKEVDMNPYLETTITTQDIVSEIVRENEVVEEHNYTQRQLPQEQNARILQEGILTKHLCKPKEIEITHDKMNYKAEGKKKQKSSKREASGTMYDGADVRDSVGLSQQSNSEHTDNQQTSDENTVIFVNKVGEKKKQKKREVSGDMDDGADDSDSGAWSKQSNREQAKKQQVSILKDTESDRFTLKEEKEKKQKVDLLYEKNRVQLRKKEVHSIKEVDMNPYLETTITTQDIVSEIVRENEVVEEHNYTQRQLPQEQNARILQEGILTKHLCKPKEIEITQDKMNNKVSESSDKEKSLLNENRMLWDEIAKLRLQIDTAKNQTQEMGKKHFQDIAIVQEKNDCLQKTIRKTVSQHNEQLEVLRAELIMLNSKLEQEQQNRGRLEEEIESYRYILATAVQDHENCQTSKRDLQLAFQRERDEWICLQEKMNFDVSNLQHNIEILSEQLSKMESKNNNLEIELHRTIDALKERTLVLERDRSQKQRQTEEIERVCEEEQGQVDKDSGKQESLQETLSHLHSENLRLHQQLDRAHSKAEREENTAINMQQQILEKINIFEAKSVKKILKLKESINELINEWHHFKERIYQYEKDNIERDAIVRQFQEELAIVRQLQQKMSMTEASLEVESHHPLLIQDKTHELKKEIEESRSQPHHEKEESKKYIDLQAFLQQRLQQEMNKKDDLGKEETRLKELLKAIKKKLNECDNEELSFPEDLKPNPANMEIQSKKPKQKNDELITKLQPSSSKCVCQDEEKPPQHELSVEPLLKRREELKDRVKKAKQEAVNLRTYMETNMVEYCEVEEYKKKIEERAKWDVADTIEQVNSLLQAQRASQVMSEQMINDQTSTISPLEHQNKELKSELSRVKTSQDDIKRELEKYVRLYQEQLEGTKLLENKLTDFPRTKERLAEISTKLLLEKQLNRLLLSKRNSTPAENLEIPTSRPCTATYRRTADPIFYQHIHDSSSQAAFGSPALRTGSSRVTTGPSFLEDSLSFPANATAPDVAGLWRNPN